MLKSDDHNFSFSGLKTAVRYLLPGLTGDYVADVCASFQRAVIEVLVAKTVAGATQCHVDLVTISGGVSCNKELRRLMQQACEKNRVRFLVAEPRFCTDNAAMIASAAMRRLAIGKQSEVIEEIDPNLALV